MCLFLSFERTLVNVQRSVRINARTYDQQPITVSTDIRKSLGDSEPPFRLAEGSTLYHQVFATW